MITIIKMFFVVCLEKEGAIKEGRKQLSSLVTVKKLSSIQCLDFVQLTYSICQLIYFIKDTQISTVCIYYTYTTSSSLGFFCF